MADVCVTVPKGMWESWLSEGDLPGFAETGGEYAFYLGGPMPNIEPGERVYIVAHGKLRGYAPLIRIMRTASGYALIRGGGAVACTIPGKTTGFRGWRYRWWNREDEVAFPTWMHP